MINNNSIAKKSLIISILLGSSSLLGLIRESSIAYMFGASSNTDAYFVAMMIPSLFISTISSSITSTFVTVYSGYIVNKDIYQAQKSSNVILTSLFIILGLLYFILMFFTPTVVSLFAPDYSLQKLDLTSDLTRILLPNLLFGGLLGILTGINNSNGSFIAPASVGLILNIVVIISTFTLGEIWGIYGLALGTTLGIVAQFILQIPSAYKHGLRYKFIIDLHDPGFREVFKMVLPFILAASVGQLNTIIDRSFATSLSDGVVTALYFAGKITFLPQIIFSGAVSMVALPLLAKYVSLKDWDNTVKSLINGIRLLVLLLIPSAVIIILLNVPIVEILFQRGSFTTSDKDMTASLMPYILGAMFFGGIVGLLNNIYFAMKHTKYLVLTSIIGVVIKLLMSYLLINSMKQWGLVLADSISGFTIMLMQIVGLFTVLKFHKRTSIPFKDIFNFIKNIIISSMLMFIIIYFVNKFTLNILSDDILLIIKVVLLTILGLTVFLVGLYFLKVSEIRSFINKKLKIRNY
ncbi:murein biosynthesis integral membrane protein MurJ [Terrilactibacillus laevilacticus]|uniref:murein biosynthesis integral membrane protein MurJ n=1 Tax=Terrilactibacillus laevilacticus TaxID=1380157 RepID=UPI001147193C|nr:murein biosynthesis integral membrane protein MurJ [Terrilactibacillus laevilacticus]